MKQAPTFLFDEHSPLIILASDDSIISFKNSNVKAIYGNCNNIKAVFSATELDLIYENNQLISSVFSKDGVHYKINWSIELLESGQTLFQGVIECKPSFNDSIYQQIIDSLPVPIFWKNTHHVFLGCNKAFARNAGFDEPQDLIGKMDVDMPWKIFSEKYIQDDKRVLNNKKTVTYEEENERYDGSIHTVFVTKAPLYADNQLMGIVGTFFDITDKKQVEKLSFEKKNIEEVVHYTKLAAGAIAHDLRTPLGSIKFSMVGIEDALNKLSEAYNIALEAGLSVPKIRKNRLKQVLTSTKRCQNEVDFSNGYIDMVLNNLKQDSVDSSEYKVHEFVTILENCWEAYPCRDNDKELLHFDIKNKFSFWGSDFYLKNILNNLLQNAYHFIKSCNRGEIFISTSSNDEFNIVRFRDTAKGASPEVVDKLFLGYFTSCKGGTGLGLAFSKAIMKSFGGNITAHSVEGEFMEFILTFPKI